MSATTYLWDPAKYPVRSVCALFGDDSLLKRITLQHLRHEVLQGEDAEFSFQRFDGSTIRWLQVLEEVSTVAMFGSHARLAVIDDADDFVTKNRAELEDYVEKPSANGILVLLMKTLAANTNLYKKLEKTGRLIECKAPSPHELPSWLVQFSQLHHRTVLETAAAELLVEHIGCELGLLDQEIAKLALMVEPNRPITVSMVAQHVGSWRTRSTFDMLDLAMSGKTAAALRQLDLLLLSGENVVGMLAQMAASIRKIAAAGQLLVEAETTKKPIPSLANALEQAGVARFFIAKTEQQMKSLGKNRARRLLRWLLQTDLDLKGASRAEPRQILETLIVRLAAPQLK